MSPKNIRDRSPLKLKVKKPSSPGEAKKWLETTAEYLSQVPNASHALLFVAHGLNNFLTDNVPLPQALGLKSQKDTKPGRPSVSTKKVKEITTMLVQQEAIPKIVKTVRVSKSVIERVRADLHAIDWSTALSKIDIGEELPAIEDKDAEIRASKIPKARRKAIIQGIADAIQIREILPDSHEE